MTNFPKKLKLNIKGNINPSVFNLSHKVQTAKHGLKTHSLTHNQGNVEMIIEGDKKALWRLVNYNKTGPLFCTVEELTVQFI